MGFDVVYLPPVHPIGHDAIARAPTTPSTPARTTPASRGRSAPRPAATTRSTRTSARSRTSTPSSRAPASTGLEIALDLALQASPDHPWVTEHPDWFSERADGTIAYAENPPKKYQDIYPLNFDHDYAGLYAECRRIAALLDGATASGSSASTTRTPSPCASGRSCSPRSASTDPDVLFLAEAFTRPAMMRQLAAVGFHQSYTYFTWRNAKWELEAVLHRARRSETAHVLRPELLRQHPGHPPRVPAVRRPAGVQDPCRPGGDPVPDLGRLLRLRALRARRRPAGQRGVPRLREVRLPPAGLGRGGGRGPVAGAVPHAAQRDPRARTRPCTGCATSPSTPPTATRSCASPSARATTRSSSSSTSTRTVPARPPCAWTCRRSASTWGDHFAVHDEITGATLRRGASDNYVRLDPFVEPAHVLTSGAPVTAIARALRGPDPFDDRVARTPTGSSAPSSTRCSSARSPTATATARGDLRGLTQQAGLPRLARRRLPVAAAVLRLTPARRRLRRRALHRGAAGVRDPRRLRRVRRRRARARHARDHRLRHEPHERPAPVVPGQPLRPDGSVRRLLRLVRHRRRRTPTRGSSSSTPRRRTGRSTRSASSTSGTGSSATSRTSTSRTPTSQDVGPRGAALLAGRRHRRVPARRRARTSSRTRAPTARTSPPPTSSSSGCARRSTASIPTGCMLAEANQWPEDVVDYLGDPDDRWRRVPHGLPLPGDAPAVHGRPARVSASPSPRSSSAPRRSRAAASGASSCATTTS